MNQLSDAPQSIGGVLDTGFKLFRGSLKQTFWLAAGSTLCSAPFDLVRQWFEVQPAVSGTMLIGALLGGFILVALVLTFTAAAIARIHGVATDRELTLLEALQIGAHRAPAQLGSGILYGLAVVGGFLLLLIPGFIVMVTLIFGPMAAVIERLGPIASLRYSARIVRGHWWRTSAVLTVVSVIVGVLYVILLIVMAFAVSMDLEQLALGITPWYINFVLSPLLSGVATPLAYSLFLATLYDLKVRHEGADIAARIAAVSA